MADNKTFEEILAEIETTSETDPAKAKEIIAALPDEDKKKVSDALTKKATDELDKVVAAREAKRKQEDLAEEARKRNEGANLSFEQKMLQENGKKAVDTVIAQLGIDKEEDKNKVRDEFKKRNPQVVTVENLIEEAKAAATAAFPDRFIGADKRVREMKAGAADFNASMAGGFGGSSEGGEEDGEKVSKEAKQMILEARKQGVEITPDQAQAAIDDGFLRGNRRFELGTKARAKAKA